jgi:hypothetical protein
MQSFVKMNRGSMSANLRNHFYNGAIQVALALAIVLGGYPLAALAQEYTPPPNLGLPARREGGGTRGCWRSEPGAASDIRLTAIVPAENSGYTLEAYPTFFIYVPPSYAEQAAAAEFIFSDEQDNEIYRATFQTTNKSGVLSLSLPANMNLPPLEIGRNYRWSFSLVCDLSDRSADIVVDSWIQRIEPTPELTATLQTTTLEQRPALYAQSSIWYDALTSLAQLSRQSGGFLPNSQWTNLLNSVGLEHISREATIESVDLSEGTGVMF